MENIKSKLIINQEKIRSYVIMFFLLFIIFLIGYRCPFQAILGISCPGCGMTRAFLSLAHLDISKAFYYHPLFWMVPLFIIVWIFHKKIPRNIIALLIGIVCVLFFGVYLYRMIYGDGQIVYLDIKHSLLGNVIDFVFS